VCVACDRVCACTRAPVQERVGARACMSECVSTSV
jgi:hypothetical protein